MSVALAMTAEHNIDAVSNVKSHCGCCKTKLNTRCLYCDMCDEIFCVPCLGIPIKLFDVLNLREKRSTSSAVMIVCKPCRIGAFKTLASKIQTTDKDTENAEKMQESVEKMIHKVNTLTTAVNNKMAELNKLESLSEDIKQAPKKLTEAIQGSYADAVKNSDSKNSDPDIFIDVVKKVMAEKEKEDQLKEKEQERGSSIIMYNCPESNIKDIVQRKQHEKQTVDDFITKGIQIRSLEIKSMYRKGKFNSDRKDKTRPLKIVFQEKLAAAKIFKNVSNLREADQRYKRISLQRDLTRTEITAFNEKLKEAKEMNRNNDDETKYFVVRGPPTKLEIRKIEAKHRPRTQNTNNNTRL